MMGKRFGKILFLVGLFLVVVTLLVREFIFGGIRVSLVVNLMYIAVGMVIVGGFIWLTSHSEGKIEKIEEKVER